MTSSRQSTTELLFPFLAVLLDALAIECSFLFSYWLRFHSSLMDSLGFVYADAPPLSGYVLGSLVVTVIWLMLFNTRRMYRLRRSVTLADEVIAVAKTISLGMLIMMSAAFFYRGFSYSRVVFGLVWLTSILFISCGRGFLIMLERAAYRRGRRLKHVIIVGKDLAADDIFARLHHHPSFGFAIDGYFADSPVETGRPIDAAPYLGTLAEAPAYIREHRIDLAFLTVRAPDHRQLFELISECEGVNIEFMLVPDVLEVLTSQVTTVELEGIPFLKIKNISMSGWGKISKRIFDIVVSLTVLIALSPLWVLIALLVKLTSRGPVLFKQERVGVDGQKFVMLKFRSMRPAEERGDAGDTETYNRNERYHRVPKDRDDQRRTRLGILLRKTSLDELPQLWNVLRGDMSLVGPRPERIQYVRQFGTTVPRYLDRHRVKTGVTGWAQVNGLRGDTSIEERIKYDLYYIENWSLALDVKILLRTLHAALSMKEAR